MWLRNLTGWRIADQLRQRKRGRAERIENPLEPADLEEVPDPASVNLDAFWEQEWQSNLFEAAVARVKRTAKAEHYQMFDLYVFKQWPVSKVVRVLGVRTSQVYLAKHRITALIKKEIRALEKEYL